MEHIIPQDFHIDSVCKYKLHMFAKGGTRLFYRDGTPALRAFPKLVGFKPNSGSVEYFVLLESPVSVKFNSLYFGKSYWLPGF